MGLFKLATVLLFLACLASVSECYLEKKHEGTKAGILQICSQFIEPRATNKLLCLICKGFDFSCFSRSTTTSTTTSSTTTSSSTTSTPSTSTSSTSSTTSTTPPTTTPES